MKRTPIITVGQVYLHPDLNEYMVVTQSTRGLIQFKGVGFGGVHDVDLFLDRFGPVDPGDLDSNDVTQLTALMTSPVPLLVGWVKRDDDEEEDDE